MEKQIVAIELPSELAEQMPEGQDERQQVIRLGLKHLRIQKALEEYRRGGYSLAYAAQQAGIFILQKRSKRLDWLKVRLMHP